MTAGTLADADATAVVLARSRVHPAVLAAYGDSTHISGLNEAPYPHLRIRPGGAGTDGNLRWLTEQEVLLESLVALDGTPGQWAIKRIHYVAVTAVASLPMASYSAADAVISAVRSSIATQLATEPVTGQLLWRTGLIVTIHPPVAIP